MSKKGYKIGFTFLLMVIALFFLFKIKMVLLPFLAGIILAYLFNPFIDFLVTKRGFSRSGALLLLLISILNLTVISGLILFPVFIEELENLSEMVPGYINSIEDLFEFINKEYQQISLPLIIKESLNQSLQELEIFIINFIHKLTEILLNSLSLIFSLLLAPIISYYILKDLKTLQKSILMVIPKNKRRLFSQIGREINDIFVGFLRGQIWISVVVGVLASVGLFFLHIKFFLILGLLAAITNMIPYIGPIIGAFPALFIAFLASPVQALGVVLLYIFIQQLESSIIAPRIISKKVGLHPLTIIFSLLAGAELLGAWGLFFGVPVAGSIKVLVKLLLQQFTPLNE